MFVFRAINYHSRNNAFFYHRERFQSQSSTDHPKIECIVQENTVRGQSDLRKIEIDQIIHNELGFFFDGEKLLLQMQDNIVTIPTLSTLRTLNLSWDRKIYIGQHDGKKCFILNAQKIIERAALPIDMNFHSLREAHVLLSEQSISSMLLKAIHVFSWDKKTQFCGACGTETLLNDEILAKNCSDCGSLIFPQFSPAMLALIWRNDEILLARAHTFKPGIYNILAGFVEAGETVEQTVVREVREEVGIEIKNIRYVASQPWPFPSNLMFGFTAEYAAGRLQVNKEELDDAQWFSIDRLPPLPDSVSLSRQMIESHISSRKQNIQSNQQLLFKSMVPKRMIAMTALVSTGLLMVGFWKSMKDDVQSSIAERPKNSI